MPVSTCVHLTPGTLPFLLSLFLDLSATARHPTSQSALTAAPQRDANLNETQVPRPLVQMNLPAAPASPTSVSSGCCDKTPELVYLLTVWRWQVSAGVVARGLCLACGWWPPHRVLTWCLQKSPGGQCTSRFPPLTHKTPVRLYSAHFGNLEGQQPTEAGGSDTRELPGLENRTRHWAPFL